MIKRISSSLIYIGVDDLDLDRFESQYAVPEGMAYNSYLIEDEKIAILDTVDARKGDEWKANLTGPFRPYCRCDEGVSVNETRSFY